jgi:hypothetical protein
MPQKGERGSRYKVALILNISCFITGKDPRITLYRSLGEPQGQFRRLQTTKNYSWFQTFTILWMVYSVLWMIHRRHPHKYPSHLVSVSSCWNDLWSWDSSEMSAQKIQTPGSKKPRILLVPTVVRTPYQSVRRTFLHRLHYVPCNLVNGMNNAFR